MSQGEQDVRAPSPLEIRLYARSRVLDRMAVKRRELMERAMEDKPEATPAPNKAPRDKRPKRVQFADQLQEPEKTMPAGTQRQGLEKTMTAGTSSMREQRMEREMAFEMEEVARKERMRETRKIMREALAKLPKRKTNIPAEE